MLETNPPSKKNQISNIRLFLTKNGGMRNQIAAGTK
jgi:hypothetical protein